MDGSPTTHEECLYALLVMQAISTINGSEFRRVVELANGKGGLFSANVYAEKRFQLHRRRDSGEKERDEDYCGRASESIDARGALAVRVARHRREVLVATISRLVSVAVLRQGQRA